MRTKIEDKTREEISEIFENNQIKLVRKNAFSLIGTHDKYKDGMYYYWIYNLDPGVRLYVTFQTKIRAIILTAFLLLLIYLPDNFRTLNIYITILLTYFLYASIRTILANKKKNDILTMVQNAI